MSITDELREWGSRWEDAVAREVIEIADRIDAELAERYVELPKDADGVPIRVGDVVAANLADGGKGQWAVDRMELTRCYGQDMWQVALDKGGAAWVTPSTVTHAKPDSWERIIADAVRLGVMAEREDREDSDEDAYTAAAATALVERCRRLAGER